MATNDVGAGSAERTPVPLTGSRRWQFADVEVDERSLELRVGGMAVALARKPLQVLLHLLRHAGEVVTKDELAEACWPGRVLSDSVLTTTIKRLRTAIGDDDQQHIRTAHGFGYRFAAPVTVTWLDAAPAPQLALVAGVVPPKRENWRLASRIGAGGNAELWLATQQGTAERRVLKFARDAAGLAGLKREVALFGVLAESPVARDGVLRILDWNLAQAPFFVEVPYLPAGSLLDWSVAVGGLGKVDLPIRLAIIARIAEVLAAAHRLGVLHLDLKPANVLVSEADPTAPQIVLADFGQGGLADETLWHRLQLTRTGLADPATGTGGLASSAGGFATGYRAPEVMAGQASTSQADIYALGVMLYQIVVGDFQRPLAPGWERDIPDPVLRADIARAVDGVPERRLGDAALLARDLRRIDERRREHAAAEAGEARRVAMQRALEQANVRRRWMTVSAGILALALAAVSLLYARLHHAQKAQQVALARSEVEARRAQTVREFVMHLFRSAGDDGDPNRVTARAVVDQGARQLQDAYTDDPAQAAELLGVLGKLYLHLHDYVAAASALQQVVDHAGPATPLDTLADARFDLAMARFWTDQPEAARTLLEQSQSFWRQDADRYRENLLVAQTLQGQIERRQGQLDAARVTLGNALAARLAAGERDNRETAILQSSLAALALQAGDLDAAEAANREAARILDAIGESRSSDGLNVINNRGAIAYRRGALDEAEAAWQTAIDLRRALFGPSAALAAALGNQGRLLLRLDRADEALPLLREALELARRYNGERSSLAVTEANALGAALLAVQHDGEAAVLITETLTLARETLPDSDPQRLDAELQAIGLQVAAGERAAADAALASLQPTLAALGTAGDRLRARAAALSGPEHPR